MRVYTLIGLLHQGRASILFVFLMAFFFEEIHSIANKAHSIYFNNYYNLYELDSVNQYIEYY